MSAEEIIELLRPFSGSGAVFTAHMRDEGDDVMRTLDETFRIARKMGVPVVVSRHKVTQPVMAAQAALEKVGKAPKERGWIMKLGVRH